MTLNGLGHLLASLIVIGFIAPAAAQEKGEAEVWSGYKLTTEVTLPFADVAEFAAVRIEATYIRENETSLGALTTVRTAEAQVVTDAATLDHDSRLMQIETCRRQSIEICPILSVGGSGSGFIDNGNQLYTCRHVVGDWPLAAALLNGIPMSRVLPPLILRNQKGELLYNSAYSDNAIRFDLLNDDPRLHEERILRYRALAGRPLPKIQVNYSETLQYLLKASDFVAMKSDADVIPAVALSGKREIAAGDVFYLSGFPSRTGLLPAGFDVLPETSLVTSVLTTKLYSPALPLLMAQGLQRPGGSGGMVTNAAGEVIGMSCFADAANAYAFAFDVEAQRQFWGQLQQSSFADVLGDLPIEAASRE